MVQQTGVQSQVGSYQRFLKWYLMPPCLTPSIISYVSRAKWSNPGNVVATSSIPRCCSYWKGGLRASLDKGRQLTNLHRYNEPRIYIYIYICVCVCVCVCVCGFAFLPWLVDLAALTCGMNWWPIGRSSVSVAGSISSGGDLGMHCWWDPIRSKQLFSVPYVACGCLPDFLVMAI